MAAFGSSRIGRGTTFAIVVLALMSAGARAQVSRRRVAIVCGDDEQLQVYIIEKYFALNL